MNFEEKQNPPLYFIKLGGSLITEKSRPQTPRPDVLQHLAADIAGFQRIVPDTKLLIGHGSGSFGHVSAKKFGTRNGVQTHQQWLGFAEVWRQANLLNRLVIDALSEARLPVISFPPSASVTAEDGRVLSWDTTPIRNALQSNLLPVIQGDVIFDAKIGGTILSTEDLFNYLARQLRPIKIFLAGIEPGVWRNVSQRNQIIHEISIDNFDQFTPGISGSAFTDVTGGMLDKVKQSLALIQEIPRLQVIIFSAEQPGNLLNALCGEMTGTCIHG